MEARLIQECHANERPLTLEEWRDEAGLLQDLANKLMTESAALHETIATLRAERDRLRKAYGDLGEEANSLRAELTRLKKHYRQPAHGPCCTCQHCGRDYDECRCDLDDVASDLSRERVRHQELRQVVKLYQDECPNCDFNYVCLLCRRFESLLEPQPAPVDTPEEK